jgi:transposase
MKAVKIKVTPTAETLEKIPAYLSELEWLWNKCRWLTLHNYCLDWYGWAEKKMGVDLKGCILAPLYFDRRSAYVGASCRIATGGLRWAKDESVVIPYRVFKKGKWELRTKHGSKLIKGDRPYESIKPVAHQFPTIGGRELKKTSSLDSVAAILNPMREAEGLPPISIPSDFIGGIIKDFDTAWDAYADTKLSQRHQPLYKDGKERSIDSLNNNQKAPKYDAIKGEFVCCGLKFEPCDRSWEQRVGDSVWRSYKIVKRASGWYLCISVASKHEALSPTLTSRRKKAAAAAKKGITGKDAQKKALSESAEYQAAVEAISANQLEIEIEQYLASPASKLTGHTAGIDPGVKAIAATDGGHVFRPNVSRGRIALHIEALQSRLDGMRESNDKRLGASWRMGKREATANEKKLQSKISRLHERGANSSNMFNHKLATRLARTYDALYWEDTQLGNMSKGVEAKLSEDGTHYEENGSAAKTGLNYAIRHACMGDLRSKAEQRMNSARKTFEKVPAKSTSQLCHCCGQKGDRAKQDTFFCLNDACELHLVKQHADVNAAQNIKRIGQGKML